MPAKSPQIDEKGNRYGPKYGPHELDVIQRFLASCLLTARHSLARVKETAGKDASHKLFAGQIRYYNDIASGFLWALHMSGRRQTHLLNPDNEELQEILRQCKQQQMT